MLPAGSSCSAQDCAHERRTNSGYEHDADEPPDGHGAGGVGQRQ